MILEYDTRQSATVDQKVKSLMESVQRALNKIEADGLRAGASVDGDKVRIYNVQGKNLVGEIDGRYVFVKNLDADNIITGDIAAERLTSAVINAINASIGTIDADHIDVEEFVASEAFIQALTASIASFGYITAGEVEADYARIDAANIEDLTAMNAWVDKILIQTGLVANEGSVFTLDAIEVNASNITAGTIDVERLIVTQDGQKYLIHFDAAGTPSYEKLDGDIIEDRTITADKIVAKSITSAEIAARAITAIEIAAGTITANEMNMESLQTNLARIGPASGYHIELTPQRLSFCLGQTEVAYISKDKLYITQSVVLTRMDIGNPIGVPDPSTGVLGKGQWSWKVHANSENPPRNNLYLKWNG